MVWRMCLQKQAFSSNYSLSDKTSVAQMGPVDCWAQTCMHFMSVHLSIYLFVLGTFIWFWSCTDDFKDDSVQIGL